MMVIAILVLLFLSIIYFREKNELLCYTSLGLLIIIGVSATIWDKVRLKRFVCPQCRRKLSETTIKHRKEGDPINYYCPDCDIEWETGLSESTSS